MFGQQPVDCTHRPLVHAWPDLFCQRQVVAGVSFVDRFRFAGCQHRLVRVLTQRLQQPIPFGTTAAFFGDHQRLPDQA
jgi:hypothetical protein